MGTDVTFRPRIHLKDGDGMALLRRIPKFDQGSAIEAVWRDAFRSGRAQQVLIAAGIAEAEWSEMVSRDSNSTLSLAPSRPQRVVDPVAHLPASDPLAPQPTEAPTSQGPEAGLTASRNEVTPVPDQETTTTVSKPVKTGLAIKGLFGNDLAHLRET